MTRAATARPLLLGLLAALLAPAWTPAPATAAPPDTSTTRVVSGLSIPWDVTWAGQLMLFNERAGRVWSMRPGAAARRVSLPLPKLYVNSEGGLLGMVADPAAASNGFFYTCQSVATSSGRPSDVQVWKWRLTSDTIAVKVRTMVKGIPIGSGRHNGCRLEFRSDDMLYIGTGDSAKGTAPQNLDSLGGKILRVRSDGAIPTFNPYYARGGKARYVFSRGHRNVQGLALRPGTTELWAVEHGPARDDEVNFVLKRGNYGWAPTPGYNEGRAMTDRGRFPKARVAAWRSGSPTVATSGATFLSGSRWGEWDGLLAVALLKGEGILLFRVSGRALVRVTEIARSYGRVRTVEQGPDGALYFTTSNGSGRDGIYRLAPA